MADEGIQTGGGQTVDELGTSEGVANPGLENLGVDEGGDDEE